MPPTFQSAWWEILVPEPWIADDCKHCVEFTLPESVGALHISESRKRDGIVLDAEVFSELTDNCPHDTEIERVGCGDFKGYSAEYTDFFTA